MKLIDNRYKVQSPLGEELYNITYEVIDIWDGDRRLLMTLYNDEGQCQVVKYFIDNFIQICRIKHKYLLESRHFNIIRTINGKRTRTKQYYTTTEYNDNPSLDQVYENLDKKQLANIILQVCTVLDFLHHRGVTYKHLSPSNIYLTDDGNIKIQALSAIYENATNANYDDLTRYFIAPEVLIGHEDLINKNGDKYSLGMLIKYLFTENFYEDGNELFKFKAGLQLNSRQMDSLNKLIPNWIKNDSTMRKGSLRSAISEISKVFGIGHRHDLKEERGFLNFNTKLVGREKELSKILEISHRVEDRVSFSNFILVDGGVGVGKSRLLREVNYQLKVRGLDAYFIEIADDHNSNINPITTLLRQTIKDASKNLLNKYRDELSKVLPELNPHFNMENLFKDIDDIEKLRLYDRITRYLEELSREGTIYFIIDDVEKASSYTISLLEYIRDNLNKGSILFILSYNSKSIEKGSQIDKFFRKLNMDEKTHEIELYNLNLRGIEEFIQHILGINYKPFKFAAFMLKESQGNPKQIEYIIKNLYSTGELLCNSSGRWEIETKRYSDIYVPTKKEESLKNQMALLKGEYMDIMNVVSICNTFISKRALLSLLDTEAENLDIKLDRLIGMGLLEKRVADWGYSYSISNIELEKLIYHNLSKRDRIRLHKEMALFIEREYGDNYNIVLEELTYHLMASNQLEKALDYLVKGAKSDIEIYGIQSMSLWKEAYEISKDIDSKHRLEILENLGNAYADRGDNHEALKIYSELLLEATAATDTRYLIISRIGIGKIYLKRNLIKLAMVEAKEAIKLSRTLEWLDGLIEAELLYNRILLNQAKIAEVRKNMEKLLDISIRNGLEQALGSIYNMLGITSYFNGDTDQALQYYNSSISAFKKLGMHAETLKPMNNIGKIYMECFGDNDKAMEYYRKALKIAETYRILDMEMILLNNIGESCMDICEYDRAMEHIERAKVMAIDMEDSAMIFLTNLNLGLIYLLIGDCIKAYSTYSIIQESNQRIGTYGLENMGRYYQYLGIFYFHYGKLDESVENLKDAMEVYKGYNHRQYLIAKSRLALIKYIKDPTFGRTFLENVRVEIRDANLGFNRRRILLDMAMVLYLKKDIEGVLDILGEDGKLKGDYPFGIYDYINNMLQCLLDIRVDRGECATLLETNMAEYRDFRLDRQSRVFLGYKFLEEGKYYKAINYLLEAFELLYELIKNIPDRELQVSYIKGEMGDQIKKWITEIVYRISRRKIEYITTDDLDSKESIEDYFDYSPLLSLVDDESFKEIVEPYYDYEGIEEVEDIETLISRLTDDYGYNIDLILKYIAKETLAERGYILSYDDGYNEYIPIISIGDGGGQLPNENLLALANRGKNGILISNNQISDTAGLHRGFLPEGTRALLCIPIRASQPKGYYGDKERQGDRRRRDSRNNGYIYMETSNIVNRFDNKRHNLAYAISKLINTNMESYEFKTLSITDKLTGTHTREYFENEINNIIAEAARNDESFALIMLDIDRFKNINDIYGHRKGDEVLNRMGQCLINSIRRTDLVARYGGEEFIIVINDVDEEEAFKIGEKIRTNIERMRTPKMNQPITISIGISMYPRHSQLKEDLIDKADQALYGAKKGGRNRTVMWSPHISDSLSRADRLAGIISGNINKDQRRVLSILDIIELTKEKADREEKIFKFLGGIIEILGAKTADMILVNEHEKIEYIYGRSRLNQNWTQNKQINYDIVKRAISGGVGEFLIDWENIGNVDDTPNGPDWQSIVVIPLIFEGRVKAVVYIAVPIREKEFDYNSYNLGKVLCDIFSSVV